MLFFQASAASRVGWLLSNSLAYLSIFKKRGTQTKGKKNKRNESDLFKNQFNQFYPLLICTSQVMGLVGKLLNPHHKVWLNSLSLHEMAQRFYPPTTQHKFPVQEQEFSQA